MSRLVVVENIKRWSLDVPGVEVVPARSYLVDPRFSGLRRATVFNLCRTYGYQGLGYYVSLLAAARGHRALPSVDTLQDLRLSPVVRIVSEEIDELIQRSLAPLVSESFEMSIYFGRNLARRYDPLSRALFNQFPAPLLRASFVREGRWKLQSVRPIATSEIPETHRDFVRQQATSYLTRPSRTRPRQEFRYDLAILADPQEEQPPSDASALRKFIRAARALGIDAELIGRDDRSRIAEYDALFIRETTSVDHFTYRLARQASALGLVVIDDPESIVRCTNKVYQAELFARHGVPSPPSLVVHEDNVEEVAKVLGLPCVLKRPDSSFSQGVVKVSDAAELEEKLKAMFEDSELVVAQAFVSSTFDWRIGVLARRALFACKYHMARGHWQIIRQGKSGQRRYGRVDAVPLEEAPPAAVAIAEHAAGLIGDGFYGVDLKEIEGRFVVMEVNDNPNVESGYEDAVLGDALYDAVMRHFLTRLDARGAGNP